MLKWRALNRRFKTEIAGALAPDPNEEYLLYQTLVGAWPFDGEPPASTFVDRIWAYLTKALRESKVHTSWLSPDDTKSPSSASSERFSIPAVPRRFWKPSSRFRHESQSLGSTMASHSL